MIQRSMKQKIQKKDLTKLKVGYLKNKLPTNFTE